MVEQIYINNGIQQNIIDEINAYKDTSKMFRVRRVTNVLKDAASTPDPVALYPVLIIENEITILFADTGIGKSTYAVQICEHVSQCHRTLLVDLELADKQFEKRCRHEDGSHYKFSDNFFRADFTEQFILPEGGSYEEYFIHSLNVAIEETGAKFIVIDNMTKLSTSDTDTSKASIPIMNSLLELKKSGVTLFLLEHNKKVDGSRPISLNDLQGSKMKANFADAVFTIGRSQKDSRIRYVKQLKVRSAECLYDTDNVMVCELTHEGGLLHFKHIGFGSELEHLRTPSCEKEVRTSEVDVMHKQGISNSEIARRYGVSEGAVRKWLKKNNNSSRTIPPA